MNIKHFILLLYLFISVIFGQVASDTQVTTAVLDFDGHGISPTESIALTQRLSDEMVNTKVFVLADRSQIKDKLRIQGFQQSGCTTAECAVKIGNVLGVQQVVSGSFTKSRRQFQTYKIEAKLFSVETGKTVRVVNKNYVGGVDGLITQVERVAWDLAGIESPAVIKEKADIPLEKPTAVLKEKADIPPEEPKVTSSGGKKWLRWVGLLAIAGGVAYALTLEEEDLEDLSEPPPPPPNPRVIMGGGR